MAIELAELIESLKRELNPPGSDLFPDSVDDEWLGQLQDSFWEAKLYGFFDNFSEAEGFVSPISGTDEMDRASQELVVLFAGARVLRSELKNTNTLFKAEAGSVSFHVENSATLLRDILKDLRSKIDLVLATMSDLNSTTVAYVDSLIERTDSIYYGDTWFARG